MANEWEDEESFAAAIFPLPFRALSLICLGLLAWATNLHILHTLGLDATSALDIRAHDSVRTPLPTSRNSGFRFLPHPSTSYNPIYKLFASCSIWCFFIWCIYRYTTYENLVYVDVFKYLPAVAALGLLIGLVAPFDVLESPYRDALLTAIKRCIAPSVSNNQILFCDVILADIFTSYAKVFGDLWLSICMLFPGGSLLIMPPQEGWSQWILPTLMSIPYLVRFRQCMVEYTAPTNESRRPLHNAIKYATSFPVIYLSAAQRVVASADQGDQMTQNGGSHIFRLWLLCAAINSMYSFWWDVTNDWGFDLLLPKSVKERRDAASQPPRPLMLPAMHSKSASVPSSAGSSPVLLSADDNRNSEWSGLLNPEVSARPKQHPFGLRQMLLLPLHFYPFIIVANLVLRLTWSIKLSPHLHSQSEGSGVMFWTEVAELVRRWMWVFVRVEWEIVKESGERQSLRRTRASTAANSVEEFELVQEDF